MRWPSLFRASRFFVVAGLIWFAVDLVLLFRAGSGRLIDVYLHDRYVVLSTSHLFLFVGSVLVIFGGVYGLFEQRHARPVNLILGHAHFWLTALPLGILFRVLYRFSQAASGDVNLQDVVQGEMRVFLWSFLALLAGQFAFLANLAIAFFRRPAGAR